MIRFTCPHCKKKLKAPESAVGRMISCPKCHQSLVIPPPIRPPDSNLPLSAGTSPMPLPAIGPAPAESLPGKVPVDCPGCGRSILIQPDQFLLKLQCSHCNAVFVLEEPAQQPAFDSFDYATDLGAIAEPSKRQGRKIRLVFGLCLIVCGILAFCLWLSFHLPPSVSNFLKEGVIDPNHGIVMDYLRNNLNDPEGLEVIAWTESEKYKTGNMALNLKYRAKNPLGTKTLHYDRFWIRNGQVITTFPEEMLHYRVGHPDWLASIRVKMKEEELRGEKSDSLKQEKAFVGAAGGGGDIPDEKVFERASKEFWHGK